MEQYLGVGVRGSREKAISDKIIVQKPLRKNKKKVYWPFLMIQIQCLSATFQRYKICSDSDENVYVVFIWVHEKKTSKTNVSSSTIKKINLNAWNFISFFSSSTFVFLNLVITAIFHKLQLTKYSPWSYCLQIMFKMFWDMTTKSNTCTRMYPSLEGETAIKNIIGIWIKN